MNTLLEVFRGSFVLKMAIGVFTFLSSMITTVDDNSINYNAKFDNLIDIELQEKLTEMDNLYFNTNNSITLK
tara:strand:+ start:38605 stop:38820 length:216 start_codon:yes stop_codon:yes gene_type:complete